MAYRLLLRSVSFLLLAGLAACGADESRRAIQEETASFDSYSPAPRPLFEREEEDEDLPTVVFLGDSLTAGLGLPEDEAYPAVLEELLAREGTDVRVVNAGVSGDTSAGGLARLSWVLRQEPDVLVVELGPNDGLRGIDLSSTEANLRSIIGEAREAGAEVLLAGLKLPPNYGPDYAGQFEEMYARIAEEMEVPMVPFLLEGVGGEPELNLPDGLHPNTEGHRIVADNVLPHLKPLLDPEEEG